ncbi:MAG: tRNA (adenosine(37)-N6)-threonylcarbamoyltransferase complex dimerization subunit type 1 TsaB [Bacillota bacterium]
MKILGIETSSVVASVAIIDENRLLGEMSINHPNTHSQKLMPLIKNLFKMLDLKIDDIDLIAVSNGPGSFTGIRIGLTTAKALAHKENIPLIDISTLDSLFINYKDFSGKVISLIDGRRGRVFVKEKFNKDVTKASVKNIEEYIKEINKNEMQVMLVGSGVTENKEYILQNINENIKIADSITNLPKASSLCFIGLNTDKKNYKNYNEIKANYLRKSQAHQTLK